MRRFAAIAIQIIIVLTGIGVLALLLWEPNIEGRNANSTLYQVYFNDPFLIYAYTASIAFFVALYQAFRFIRLIGRDRTYSLESIKAVRTIKFCAMILICFIAGALGYIFVFVRGTDDIAGGVFMGLMLTVISATVAVVAALIERRLRQGSFNRLD